MQRPRCDIDLDDVAVLHERDRAAVLRFGRHMADDEPLQHVFLSCARRDGQLVMSRLWATTSNVRGCHQRSGRR